MTTPQLYCYTLYSWLFIVLRTVTHAQERQRSQYDNIEGVKSYTLPHSWLAEICMSRSIRLSCLFASRHRVDLYTRGLIHQGVSQPSRAVVLIYSPGTHPIPAVLVYFLSSIQAGNTLRSIMLSVCGRYI